jgi:hypothetical protein
VISPVSTPATNFTLQGRIDESTGRETGVTLWLLDPTGKKIWNDNFSIELGAADFSNEPDPGDRLWKKAAPAIMRAIKDHSKDRPILLQVAGFAGTEPNREASPSSVKFVEKAAYFQVDSMLGPMTERISDDAASLDELYRNWQCQMASMIEQRSQAKANAFWGGVAVVLNGVAKGMSNYQGTYNAAADTGMAQGQSAMDISNNQIAIMTQGLSQKSDQMSGEQQASIATRFYANVFNKNGDSAQRINSYNQQVRNQLQSGQ